MVELLASYRVLVGVAVGCGLVIAGFFEVTKAPIAVNRAAILQTAILTVLPGSEMLEKLVLNADGSLDEAAPDAADTPVAYLARDASGNLVGYAIPATGMGYQDRIRLLSGYDPAAGHLTGYVVLENRETPGLGARIANDPAFLDQFRDLPMQLDTTGQVLSRPLAVVPTGSSTQRSEIDALTGATVSSHAVVDILNVSLATWLPRLHAYHQERR
jgi:electron transport complex protein RnfG